MRIYRYDKADKMYFDPKRVLVFIEVGHSESPFLAGSYSVGVDASAEPGKIFSVIDVSSSAANNDPTPEQISALIGTELETAILKAAREAVSAR